MLAQRSFDENSHPSSSSVAEIVLQQNLFASADLVMPMLAHLSKKKDDRWLTIISSEIFDRRLLSKFDFEESKIRIIRTRDDDETLWMLWESLAVGTSGYVAASFNSKLSVQSFERQKLEQACKHGRSQAIILKTL